MLFQQIIDFAKSKKLKEKSLPEIEMSIAKIFLGTPYVAKTLEKEGDEKLVVNLRQMDCTTFIENVLSFSLCIRDNKTSFSDYKNVLKSFRYRDGIIDSYPSRLHYFTEWLVNNEERSLLTVISNTFSSEPFDNRVDFMSKHPQYYVQLKNEHFLKEISRQENEISKISLNYLPKINIEELSSFIKDGDIIAITSSVDGLDIAHVGLACFNDDKLHLFHASSKEKMVVISKEALSIYLEGFKKRDGIIVARLN